MAVSSWGLKVQLNDEIRRLTVWELSAEEPTIAKVRDAVAKLYEMSEEEAATLTLEYEDKSSNRCVLSATTLADALTCAQSYSTLRVFASLPAASDGTGSEPALDIGRISASAVGHTQDGILFKEDEDDKESDSVPSPMQMGTCRTPAAVVDSDSEQLDSSSRVAAAQSPPPDSRPQQQPQQKLPRARMRGEDWEVEGPLILRRFCDEVAPYAAKVKDQSKRIGEGVAEEAGNIYAQLQLAREDPHEAARLVGEGGKKEAARFQAGSSKLMEDAARNLEAARVPIQRSRGVRSHEDPYQEVRNHAATVGYTAAAAGCAVVGTALGICALAAYKLEPLSQQLATRWAGDRASGADGSDVAGSSHES